MNMLQEHIDELNPTTEKGQGMSIVPLKQSVVGDVGETLLLLLGAVSFVLLIACANVANLLLARSAARTREFAVRRALGASRMQIIRQLITESVLLSFGGGVLGLAIAKFGLRAILAAVPGSLPRIWVPLKNSSGLVQCNPIRQSSVRAARPRSGHRQDRLFALVQKVEQ